MSKRPKRRGAVVQQGTSKAPSPGKIPAASSRFNRTFLIQCLKWIIPLGLAAIPFGLGKYVELGTPGPFDSGSYTYSAWHILHGAKIGVGEIPSAQLGTLWMNMIGVGLFGFNDVGPKIVQGLLQAVALIFMFRVMWKVFGLSAATVGVIVAATYLSAPVIAKFGNVKEQYMISFMIMGICCLILYLQKRRWYWGVLAGGLLAWGPLFKETGVSALTAAGVFCLWQMVLVIWRKIRNPVSQEGHAATNPDSEEKIESQALCGRGTLLMAGYLLAGFVLAIGPIYVWMIAGDVRMSKPYETLWQTAARFLPASRPAAVPTPAAKETDEDASTQANDSQQTQNTSSPTAAKKPSASYVEASRAVRGFGEQARQVGRYYKVLMVPIGLALAAVIGRIIVGVVSRKKKQPVGLPERLVLLFGVWWLLDMTLLWISARSYEQYYLPLNASAAMLSGYLFYLLGRGVVHGRRRVLWVAGMAVALLFTILGSKAIFAGQTHSPDTGQDYGERRRGYAQRLEEVRYQHASKIIGDWQAIGRYVRAHSAPDETLYVWGWYPGIAVQAQRVSPAARAFEANMHVDPVNVLRSKVNAILKAFQTNPPRYIVDTQKFHYPNWKQPVMDLWPRWEDNSRKKFYLHYNPSQPIPRDSFFTAAEFERYHAVYLEQVKGITQALHVRDQKDNAEIVEKGQELGETEKLRQETLYAWRMFIMEHYEPVPYDQVAGYIAQQGMHCPRSSAMMMFRYKD